jgi:hypothetical protein
MMNPSLLMDLARERRREMLEDASRSHRLTRRHGELTAADDILLLGRSAHVIDARVRAKARARFGAGEWAEPASPALKLHTSRG